MLESKSKLSKVKLIQMWAGAHVFNGQTESTNAIQLYRMGEYGMCTSSL